MTLTLTTDQIVADLSELAEARPDFVYRDPDDYETSCTYFDPITNAPSCIVGHVLAKHGLTRDDLADVEPVPDALVWSTNPRDLNSEADVSDLEMYNVIDTDSEGFELLALAQDGQDRGIPWGLAVRDALATVGID